MPNLLTTLYSFGFAGVLFFSAAPSQASLVKYEFTGSVESGSLLNESYFGYIAFDNSGLTNSGTEYLPLSQFSLNFLATDYALADASVPATADFQDGVFLGVSYTLIGADLSFSLISAAGTGLPDDLPYFAYDSVAGEAGTGSLAFVDEPVSLSLLAIGLAGMMVTRRRSRR